MNNPTSILGASSTANWRCRKEESITKRCVCALALVLLFLAVAVGSMPSRQARLQESPPMGPQDPAESNYQLGAWFDPSGETSLGDLLKGLKVSQRADGTYRIQVTSAGNGQAKFHLATVSGRHQTVLKEVDQPITEGQFLKYELVARHKAH